MRGWEKGRVERRARVRVRVERESGWEKDRNEGVGVENAGSRGGRRTGLRGWEWRMLGAGAGEGPE